MVEKPKLKREDFVTLLKRSKEIVGYQQPVVVDKSTLKIVEGQHRKEADPNWPEEYREFKTPKECILWRIHANIIRRSVSKKERASQLCELALYLEDEGVPKEQIIGEVSRLSLFDEGYVRNLLPSKYKAEKKRSAGIKSSEIRKFKSKSPLGIEPPVSTEPSGKKPDADQEIAHGKVSENVNFQPQAIQTSAPAVREPKPKMIVTCPFCRIALEVVLCSKCWRELDVKELLREALKDVRG